MAIFRVIDFADADHLTVKVGGFASAAKYRRQSRLATPSGDSPSQGRGEGGRRRPESILSQR